MDHRKLPRYEVMLPLSFSGNEAAGGGLVTSLSKEGCTIITDESVRPSACLALHVQLPEQYTPLKVETAEVRWKTVSGFGVEFRHLRAEEQERLRRFISWLETSQNN